MKYKTNYFIFSEKDLEDAFAPYLAFLTSADKSRYAHRYAFKRSDGTNTNTACFFVEEGRSTDGTDKLRVGEYDKSNRYRLFKSTRQIKNRLKRVLEPNKAQQTKEENKKMNKTTTFTPEEVATAIKPYLTSFTVRDNGNRIELDHQANTKGAFVLSLLINCSCEGLTIYLRTPDMTGYVNNMDDLSNEIETAVGGIKKLNELRSLLGLEEQGSIEGETNHEQ